VRVKHNVHRYIWDTLNPMAPVLKERLTLRSGRGAHWLTFDIKGDYGYVAPIKNGADGTEIFATSLFNHVAGRHASGATACSHREIAHLDHGLGLAARKPSQ
jgi:hypothetical protein